MAYRSEGWAAAWQRSSGVMGLAGRVYASRSKAQAEVDRQQAQIDANPDFEDFSRGTRMILVWVEAR